MLDCRISRRYHIKRKKSKSNVINYQVLTAGVILIVLVILTSVHFLSETLIEFRKKIILFQIETNTSLDTRQNVIAKRVFQEHIEIGEILPNCGLPQQCPDNSFSMHVYTGSGKDDGPRLCILGSGLNYGGRGINCALIDPTTFKIISVKNFDTYSDGSNDFENWILSEILEHDIVIFFTFDEASRNLSDFAKKLLFELGSYRIQELSFRSQWFMLTQKGIVGFTPYELLHAANHGRWAEPINTRFCVPSIVIGEAVSPDPMPSVNIARETFCDFSQQFSQHDFCEATARRESITPAQLTNKSFIGNLIFSTPWLVLSENSSIHTFEGIINQPGINPTLVHVFYDLKRSYISELSSLFGFQSVPFLKNHLTRMDKLEYAMLYIRKKYLDKKYMLVIENDLILSPDYLSYMGQVITVLDKDLTLIGASAWNPYGFENTSSDLNTVYRVNEFPGVGFLLSFKIFDNYIKGKFKSCCYRESYKGWPNITNESENHIIIPDVSRVMITSSLKDNSQRSINTYEDAYISKVQYLESQKYFQLIANIIKESKILHISADETLKCRLENKYIFLNIMRDYKKQKFVIYYKENKEKAKLKQLLLCFGLKEYEKPRNLYKGVLRLTVYLNSILFIEAKSPFYKTIPTNVTPV